MTHETKPSGSKDAASGCCGGMDKDKAITPPAATPVAKPAADAKNADHKKAGGSCC